jgi:hypothetical protein
VNGNSSFSNGNSFFFTTPGAPQVRLPYVFQVFVPGWQPGESW